MKLRRFAASDVHGYLNFDIPFSDGITFLVGANGSGKSTALVLMEAIITPSIRDLLLIDFSKASLLFEDQGRQRLISVVKNDEVRIVADWVSEPVVFSGLDRTKRELLSEDLAQSGEYFSKLAFEVSSQEAMREIAKITAPVFLGIERQHKNGALDPDGNQTEEDFAYAYSARRNLNARRILKGNLAAGLFDTQRLVREAYKTARRQQDAAQDRLRTDVLLSAFRYSDIEKTEAGAPFFGGIDSSDFERLEASQQEISEALSDLGVSPSLIEEKVGTFFTKLSLLARRMGRLEEDDSSENTLLEFLTNRGHVSRLKDLINLIQEFKKKTDRFFGRIDQFKEFMNWFYSDSQKKVSLDQVGRLIINRKDGRHVPLDALSSGERQLLIIFSHIFFNAFGVRSRVFVIDEPELSLHLRWQEHLVDKIQAASPDVQLIFATHSPDIVGDLKSQCVRVD